MEGQPSFLRSNIVVCPRKTLIKTIYMFLVLKFMESSIIRKYKKRTEFETALDWIVKNSLSLLFFSFLEMTNMDINKMKAYCSMASSHIVIVVFYFFKLFLATKRT